MHFTTLSASDTERRLKASVSDLADAQPELSAIHVLTSSQRNGFILLLVLVTIAGFVSVVGTGIVLMASATIFYAAGLANRCLLFWRSRNRQYVETVSDADALAVPDDELPTYTILVPAYHEPEVIGALLANLGHLKYPRDRLDIKILLEADDTATIDAISRAATDTPFEVVLIPAMEPRTKPKALNYGLSLSDSELVTVYDVEDKPEPLQLRRAAVAMARLGGDVACLQAKLSYENVNQNLITKWFTLEYAMWFSLLLPGLVASDAPIPLGGTSNHFRRRALQVVGAWDPYNVTEDADLGIRLHRRHYSVKILDSVTLEEANSDFVNWVKQRSRWYKGYLQTFLIHLRQPRRLREDVGSRGVGQIVMFVGATPLLALINPFFWTMTIIWFIGHPHFIKAIFPAPVFYISIICWSLGNFAITYMTLLTARSERRYDLLWAALLVPVYWVMMSIAAAKAMLQLILTPSFWEKTMHGLGSGAPDLASNVEVVTAPGGADRGVIRRGLVVEPPTPSDTAPVDPGTSRTEVPRSPLSLPRPPGPRRDGALAADHGVKSALLIAAAASEGIPAGPDAREPTVGADLATVSALLPPPPVPREGPAVPGPSS